MALASAATCIIAGNGAIVFLDLDSDGDWYTFNSASDPGVYSTGKVALNNNCSSGGNLFPRANGYTVWE